MRFIRGFFLTLLSLLLVVDMILILYASDVRVTLLNPVFIQGELEKRGLYSLIREQLLTTLPQEASSMEEPVRELVTEEWLKQQVEGLLPQFYGVFLGERDTVHLVATKNNLKALLREAVIRFPPPELHNEPPQVVEAYLAEAYAELDKTLPDELRLVGEGTPEELKPLAEVRKGVDYFRLAWSAALGLAGLLILLILLISRRLRSISRILGFCLILGGAIAYGIYLGALGLAADRITLLELPPPLTGETALGLAGDFLAPARGYAFIALGLGAMLMVFSFLYRRRPKGVV